MLWLHPPQFCLQGIELMLRTVLRNANLTAKFLPQSIYMRLIISCFAKLIKINLTVFTDLGGAISALQSRKHVPCHVTRRLTASRPGGKTRVYQATLISDVALRNMIQPSSPIPNGATYDPVKRCLLGLSMGDLRFSQLWRKLAKRLIERFS